jgi:hypothetical protein
MRVKRHVSFSEIRVRYSITTRGNSQNYN